MAHKKVQKYKIVRYYRFDKPSRVIKRGLTLKQAQTHTRSPKTRGKNWFDGYTKQ